MEKHKAQEKAIREKYHEGEINKKKYGRYDEEGGKEHKESNGYRMKKDKKEEEGKEDKEGKVCKHCGKRM